MREIKLRQIKYLKENEVRQQILATSTLTVGRIWNERAATFQWDIILRKHCSGGLDISQWLSTGLAHAWLLLWVLVPEEKKKILQPEDILINYPGRTWNRLPQALSFFLRAKLGENHDFLFSKGVNTGYRPFFWFSLKKKKKKSWVSWAQGRKYRLSAHSSGTLKEILDLSNSFSTLGKVAREEGGSSLSLGTWFPHTESLLSSGLDWIHKSKQNVKELGVKKGLANSSVKAKSYVLFTPNIDRTLFQDRLFLFFT